MKKSDLNFSAQGNHEILSRQIAFTAAFLLPAAKLLEAPSILSKYAKGDLLVPAILHFLLQASIMYALLFASSRSEKTLFERLNEKLGKWAFAFYVPFAVYYIFAAILPLLDLEKFIYAAFFDTAPTVFTFAFFFILSAFICTKGIKGIGRAADLCLFLFVIPFSALIVMSLQTTDFSHLLPLFGTKFGDTMSAFTHTIPHFSDAVLLLPLIGNLKYKKGDTTKILAGYGVGALSTLLFLAVFFGVYASIAPREHYAFSKIAQYFPALRIIGRVDLIFIYLLTIVLLFFTCMYLQFATDFTCHALHIKQKAIFSAVLNFFLFLFVLFCNKYYNGIYAVISGNLPVVFLFIADMVPLFFLLIPKNSKKENDYA